VTDAGVSGEPSIEMNRTRLPYLVALALAGACIVTKPVGDADTDVTSSTADDSESLSSDSNTGPGMTSVADATTGEPDTDLLRVDCAEQDWGPTVGGGELGPLGFPVMACNPRTSGEAFGYQCCSTDPTTADGSLPAYEGKPVADGSAAIYADAANGAGTWGMCVRTTDIPPGSGLLAAAANNCPIPCNPTWSDEDVTTVCGAGRVCCQTTELGENDCVQENGVWRAVTGEDIGNGGVVPTTNWNNAAHDTHQDPNGTVCAALASDPQSVEFRACIEGLSVANQRGFCMSLGAGQSCPADPTPPPGSGPGYRSVCDLMND
jgi:hypothetical protein